VTTDDLAALPAPGALLFDLDGTLVDTVGRRIEGWQAALAEVGVNVDDDRVAAFIGADGKHLAREVSAAAGHSLAEDVIARVDRRAGALFSQLNHDPHPLPGAAELLQALLDGPLPFAIATSSLGAQVMASVDVLRLTHRPTIVDGEHVEHAKPAPDLLLLAAERMGTPPERCWYVGDAVWDFLACRAAGMTGVGVPTGAAGADELLAAGADVVIDALDELAAELRRRGLLTR
jgi:HAD superfamily hydrolase (TIGR01509 family)